MSMDSKDTRIEAGSHGQAQLLTLIQESVLEIATTDQRLLHGSPAQAGRNAVDRSARASAVMAGANVASEGQALGFLQAGIVNTIEEVFQGATHIAEIFSGA